MNRCLKSAVFIAVLFTSIAYCGNDMYWTCADPNGYWTITGNWYNSPGDPNFEYPGGLATSGGSSYDYGAYARIQQGSAIINDSYLPAGRILRLFLGGPDGGEVTIDTSGIVRIYKFFCGISEGWSSTFNLCNGTVNVEGGSNALDPYCILGYAGTSILNVSGGTLNICTSNSQPTYFSSTLSSTTTLNVSGGTVATAGYTYFGNTADNDVICNISGGTFKCGSNAYAPINGSSAVNNLTINITGGTWNPAGRAYLGNSSGSVSDINLSSGTVQVGGKQFILGRTSGGSAYYNQSGGDYKGTAQTDTVSGFLLGYTGSATGGYGEATISGGTFDCNLPVKVASGTFRVSGSSASKIYVKSINSTSGDGIAFNFIDGSGEVLAVELDSGGVTYIRAFSGGTNDPNGGKIKLDNGTLTVNTLAGFNGTAGAEYAIMYSPKTISTTGLTLTVLSPLYDFEWFVEDDEENGGQWLKLRVLTASVWNGGTGLWNDSNNWTGGIPSLTQTAMISSGTVNMTTSGTCEAKKIAFGGSEPTLNIYSGSTLHCPGELNIAVAEANTANINISGGTVNIDSDTTVASSPGSQATFNQTGGDVNIIGDLNMGFNTASGTPAEVTYNISDGNFCQTGSVFRLGYANSKGYFIQTGGNVTFDVNVSSSCRLGYSDGWGEYSISGGSLTAPTNLVVGRGQFEILGSNVDSISVDRFRNSDQGTFIVGLDGSGCTPVTTTGGNVNLESGSKIVVRRLAGFAGVFGDRYDIAHATVGGIISDEGVIISAEDANYTFEHWIVSDGSDGEKLQVGIGFRNEKAYGSSPEDDSFVCYQDAQTLSWTNPLPSETGGTILCDVWISDAATDPNFTSPTQIVSKQAVNTATVTLAADKEYLWRVDVYDQSYGAEDVVTGDVWSFTTNAVASKTLELDFENSTTTSASYQQAINGNKITVTSHASYSSDIAQNVVNGWGLEGLKHCTTTTGSGHGMWRALPNWDSGVTCTGCATTGAGWIKFDFDQVYSLGKMWVWNHNYMGSDTSALGWGIYKVTIEYSSDGTTYTVLGTYTLNDATHAPEYEHNTEIDFGGINAKTVVMTVDFYNSNYGGAYIGLSEVRFGIDGTTATETATTDAVGTYVAKCNGSVDFVHSSLYDSAKCADMNDGFDYLYKSSGVADVPADPNAAWSINCFVYADRTPEDGLLLAGFGDVYDPNYGTKRYIDAKPSGYIGFWCYGYDTSVNVIGSEKFDLRKWQMITATYDGDKIRLYKNAQLIGSASEDGDLYTAAAKVLVVPRTGRVNASGNPVHSFYGKIDDIAIYEGVLSVVEMQQLIERFPLMQDLNTDGAVNATDMDYIADEWLTTADSTSGSASGLTTWTEGFEDSNGYQSRWAAYTGDWSGKSVVADSYAPQGSSALLLTVPSNYIERSIGTVSDVFETSWYFRTPDANGTGNAIVTVADSDGLSLARVYHTPVDGTIHIYAGTGGKYYTYTPGTSYVKVTLRINQSIGRASLLINDELLESGFALHNAVVGPATGVRICKYTETLPNCYFDAVTVSQSSLAVDYPVSDINGSGFVNFIDFATFAENWMISIGE